VTRPRGYPAPHVASLSDLPRVPHGPGPGSAAPACAATSAEALLIAVADALTACRAAGLDVRLSYDAVLTDVGYVLPDGHAGWTARLRTASPFPLPEPGDDD
jgi:hypothetical protein